MFFSRLRRQYLTKYSKRINTRNFQGFLKNKNVDKKMLGKIGMRFYTSGVCLNAVTLFLGNLYYGHQLGQVENESCGILIGVGFGIAKLIVYSPFSWLFPIYATYQHINRFEIAKKLGQSKVLKAHYKMHFIPGALDNIKESFRNYDTHKFFVDKQIIMN